MNIKITKRSGVLATIASAMFALLASIAHSQNVVFTYQGRVTDNGTNFNGAGQFEFALVTSTNTSSTATATANAPSGGYITGYTVTYGGDGYTGSTAAVTVSGGGGSGATAHATVSGGAVKSVTVDNPGNGNYTSPPMVTIAAPPADITYTTYWSNDGTSVAGVEPSAAVDVTVNSGLFTVVLGDTTIANMAALDSSLFSKPHLQLRIWFNDGVNGWAALSPLQNLTPAPYAIQANSANSLPGLSLQQNADDAPNIIGGSSVNFVANGVEGATIAGGGATNYEGVAYTNSVVGIFGTVSGGADNTAGNVATVGGGYANNASGYESVVGGGSYNGTGPNADHATISGGYDNQITGYESTVGGGYENQINAQDSVVSGGDLNVINSGANQSAIGGGIGNTNNATQATIGGGQYNSNGGNAGFIGGGQRNVVGNGYQPTIGGGYDNVASNNYATVSGGILNIAGANDATVSGGNYNVASGLDSAIGGGANNAATLDQATVAGGFFNGASNHWATVGGGGYNIATGDSATVPGGYENAASGRFSLGAGQQAQATNDGAFVWADSQNAVFASTNNDSFNVRAQGGAHFVTRGAGMAIDGRQVLTTGSSILASQLPDGLGGGDDAAIGGFSAISGGQFNTNLTQDGFIGGGVGNISQPGNVTVIGGGVANVIQTNAYEATIGGGWTNFIGANADQATIAGGSHNIIGAGSGEATVAGGSYNFANAFGATVGGGSANLAGGTGTTIGGGQQNGIAATSDHAFIGGGWYEMIGDNDYEGVIAGGYYNNLQSGASYGTIGGGQYNTNSGSAGVIAGGQFNTVSGGEAAVLGGSRNIASGYESVIAGGGSNSATNRDSVVSGGSDNHATGAYSVVPGGVANDAIGGTSFAAGFQAQAVNNGAFVWSDGTGTPTASASDNSVTFRASGGYRLLTSTTSAAGVSLAAGGTSWATISDQNAKKNFAPVNGEAILDKLAQVPVEKWNYKWEKNSATPNIGPMAQAFKAAFYPGRDNKSITTLEFDGVELAAIQGLNQKLNEKDTEIQTLKLQNDSLEKRLDQLEMAIKSLNQNK